MHESELPAGFVQFNVGRSEVVCTAHVADALRDALRAGTLYRYAEQHPAARILKGRGDVYAVPLPNGADQAVIRHNRHGGLLAPVTRDLFRGPTGAPRELKISEQLREYGVPTPLMLGLVIYEAGMGFKRADVITREVPDSADLSHSFMSTDVARRTSAIVAAADVVLALSNVGARHADLNVKNILLRRRENGTFAGLVLDVDRVTFDEPEIVLELNLARLLRSAKKWQTIHGAAVSDVELEELAGLVRERRPPPMPLSTSS